MHFLVSSLFLSSLFLISLTHCAVITWNSTVDCSLGSGYQCYFTTASDWIGGVVPGPNDTAVFPGSGLGKDTFIYYSTKNETTHYFHQLNITGNTTLFISDIVVIYINELYISGAGSRLGIAASAFISEMNVFDGGALELHPNDNSGGEVDVTSGSIVSNSPSPFLNSGKFTCKTCYFQFSGSFTGFVNITNMVIGEGSNIEGFKMIFDTLVVQDNANVTTSSGSMIEGGITSMTSTVLGQGSNINIIGTQGNFFNADHADYTPPVAGPGNIVVSGSRWTGPGRLLISERSEFVSNFNGTIYFSEKTAAEIHNVDISNIVALPNTSVLLQGRGLTMRSVNLTSATLIKHNLNFTVLSGSLSTVNSTISAPFIELYDSVWFSTSTIVGGTVCLTNTSLVVKTPNTTTAGLSVTGDFYTYGHSGHVKFSQISLGVIPLKVMGTYILAGKVHYSLATEPTKTTLYEVAQAASLEGKYSLAPYAYEGEKTIMSFDYSTQSVYLKYTHEERSHVLPWTLLGAAVGAIGCIILYLVWKRRQHIDYQQINQQINN